MSLLNKLYTDYIMIKALCKTEIVSKNFILFLVLVLLVPYFISIIFTILCNGNECLKI